MDPIVIVGAGHAGGRTALLMREAGWSGPLILVGDEGEAPYERPPLSKGVLAGEPFAASLVPAGRYAEAGIEWIAGRRAVSLDRAARTLALDNGRRIPFANLLLATGGRARQLNCPGADLPGVQTLRTIADAVALAGRLAEGARMVVIGGGFIGLEVAASARARHCAVTVLEGATQVLGRGVPAHIAARVQTLHQQHGVTVRTGVTLAAIERAGEALQVRLADGTIIGADMVVVGIGIQPNVELAAAAGLACDNGIVVDSGLRTSDPGIFAAGDVAAFADPRAGRQVRRESWHNAEDHARVAAANILGGQATVSTIPWFWSDQYDHQLQMAGDCAQSLRVVTRTLGEEASIDFHLGADGSVQGVASFGPVHALAKEFRLARLLVERRSRPPVEALADPAIRLKSLA